MTSGQHKLGASSYVSPHEQQRAATVGHMTDTQVRKPYEIEGPVKRQRFGSVGFRLADDQAPRLCRFAAVAMLKRFELAWVPDLVDDVKVMVSELVTNACRHGGDTFPAGSLTMWHPNTRLVIAVHDKNPHQPWREIGRARSQNPWLMDHQESGRGLAIVTRLAERHLGELSVDSDGDGGKVITVNMLLPNNAWPHTFWDPWRERWVTGRP